MMEDMDRYQGERIWREWFDACERTIEEQGVVYVLVKKNSFKYSRIRPCDIERCIEIIPKKSNKRW